MKELSEKKEINYIEAQDLLFKDGLSASMSNSSIDPTASVGIAERTTFDNLVEDLRRSLRFYAKQTGQSFFLKVFLLGGAGETKGLPEFINSKLNIDCDVFNPFENMDGLDGLSLSNKGQYATALGLGIRGGMTDG